jgi:hypothetical protein
MANIPKYTRTQYYEDPETLKWLKKTFAKKQEKSKIIRELTKALKDKSK